MPPKSGRGISMRPSERREAFQAFQAVMVKLAERYRTTIPDVQSAILAEVTAVLKASGSRGHCVACDEFLGAYT